MGAVKNHFHDEICAMQVDDPIWPCDRCEGGERVTEAPCPDCGGQGVVGLRQFSALSELFDRSVF